MKKIDTYGRIGAPSMRAREHTSKLPELTLLAAIVILAGCSTKSPSAAPSDPLSTSAPLLHIGPDTQLLARVDLTDTHAVEFYQFRGEHIALREIRRHDNTDQRVDLESLAGKTIVEAYRTLSKDPLKPIPPELEAAAAVKHPRPQPTDAPPLSDPPKDLPTPRTGDKVSASGARAPIGGTGLRGQTSLQDWGDGNWWTYNYCQTYDVEEVWCLPNYAWATTGTRATMFYEASGMNVGTNTASFWVDEWWGYWQRIISEDLNWNWETRWAFNYQTWLASGISGNDPDWHIHFAERFRNAAPELVEANPSAHPYEDYHYWTEEIQGATQDSFNWYMANRTHIMRFPLTADLDYYPSAYVANPWSYYWAHMGDPAYGWNLGKVIVPLEPDHANGGHATGPAFGIFDTLLNGLAAPSIPDPPAGSGIPDQQAGESGGAPWVAYNPKDGGYYSSGFDPTWIYVYNISYANQVTFSRAFQILDGWGYPIQLHHIQGGAFSPSGKLYLSSDDPAYTHWGQIHVMDIYNGRVQRSYFIERHATWPGPEEMEGLTFWNSNGSAPGINGQLHLVLLDNDAGDDDWYFKHYSFIGTP